MIDKEKGLKIVRFENWSLAILLASLDKFCLGLVIKIVNKGATTRGKSIFKLGLNISFEAMTKVI